MGLALKRAQWFLVKLLDVLKLMVDEMTREKGVYYSVENFRQEKDPTVMDYFIVPPDTPKLSDWLA